MNRNREIYKLDLSGRDKMIYMYLNDRANSEGKCFPSIKTIASDLNVSRSTVKRALNVLEKEGLVEKEQRYRGNGAKSSNLYSLK